VSDGKILVAIEQERLDRIKHSTGFMLQSSGDMRQIQPPHEAMRYCLSTLGAELTDLATVTGNMPGVDWAPEILSRQLSNSMVPRVQRLPSHHLGHAYSAWSPSGFEEAIVLVADGSGTLSTLDGGRWTESYSIYRGGPNGLTLIHAERVRAHLAHVSTLGFVYEEVTRMAGFLTQMGERLQIPEAGKLMGLAPYGGPQASDRPWIRCVPGDYHLDIRAWEILLECEALRKRFDGSEGPLHLRPWIVDLAWKVQNEIERAMCHLVQTAVDDTGLHHLCLAGGVALNSVANYKILSTCGLEDLFVFPAAGDSGLAAGCALWAYHEIEGGEQRSPLRRATLGRPSGSEAISAAAESFASDLVCVEEGDEEILERTAVALAKGRVVARFEGGSEYGPRALGHRSILVDPSFERMKDVLNARVKFREAFRPFAPVVPQEDANAVFELPVDAPFMLVVPPVREECRSAIPAVVHEDGTGRVQTCSARENPFFHRLCKRMVALRGGLPVILNTSFNVAGQPIVETPREAIETFLATDIDHLAIGGLWLTKVGSGVRDYPDHVAELPKEEVLPAGLPPGRRAVLDLMHELDEAIHLGRPSTQWSAEEIAAFAARGAHLKETAVEFTATAFRTPIQTQIGENAALFIDPINGHQLVDLDGLRPSAHLSDPVADLLMALVHGEPTNLQGALRQRFDTQREWQEALTKLSALLSDFGVTVNPAPWVQRPERLSLETAARTFDRFVDEDYVDRSLVHLAQQLRRAGFEEHSLCRLLSVPSLQQIEPMRMRWLEQWCLDDSPQSDLARLFLLRAAVSLSRVRSALGDRACQTLARQGLIAVEGTTARACVDLFIADDLFFFTDHRFSVREGDALDESPVMYVGLDSLGLVLTAPREPVETALDLCCGSGIQGVVAAKHYAQQVTAVDVNPRAVRFARANAQLNGVDNFRALVGDLYGPVVGLRFDLILGNPPFVPSPEAALHFRDGGANGEAVLARIVRNASVHLTESGRIAIVSDLVDAPNYRPKLDGWWGSTPADRLVLTTAPRDEILFSEPHARRPFGQTLEQYEAELDRWVANYRRAGLMGVDFGYVLIWKQNSLPAAYVQRIVVSPTRPIYDDVTTWKASLDTVRAGGALQFVPVDGLCIIETRTASGDLLSAELSVPERPFFTTYPVDSDTVELIRGLQLGAVPLGSVLDELLALGLVRAQREASKPVRAATEVSGQPLGAGRTSTASRRVGQNPTKTTPTCLSSYLR